jgi:hypothetical protein
MNKTHEQKTNELLHKMAQQYAPIVPDTLAVFQCITQHTKQRNLFEFLNKNPIEYLLLFHFSRIAVCKEGKLYETIEHEKNIIEHRGILAPLILGYKFKNCLRENKYYNINEKKANKYFTIYHKNKMFLIRCFNYWVIEDISTIAKNDLVLSEQKEIEAILTQSGIIKYTVEEYMKEFEVAIKFSARHTDR